MFTRFAVLLPAGFVDGRYMSCRGVWCAARGCDAAAWGTTLADRQPLRKPAKSAARCVSVGSYKSLYGPSQLRSEMDSSRLQSSDATAGGPDCVQSAGEAAEDRLVLCPGPGPGPGPGSPLILTW